MPKKRRKRSPPRSKGVGEPRPRAWRRGAAAALLAIGIVLGGLALWPRGTERRVLDSATPPNVLLISVDTLRADHLGAYGAEAATPHIDALARDGVVFEWAVSHVPITLPSHASMLTGAYPIFHGVRDNGSFRLDEEQESLAETFRSAGYRTAAFVGSFALDSRFGLDQGFELYDDFYADTGDFNDFGISERSADEVLEPAWKWLAERRGERWFAFVHLYDPHAPYLPPEPFREKHAKDLYTGEIAYVDEALGRFFDRLRSAGMLDNALVVFTSDHGEGLGEHGEKTHGMFAYESTLRVPLILSWQGVLPAATRVSSRVRLIDLAPTLAEVARLSPPAGRQGASLVGTIFDPERAEHRESYFEALAFNLNRNWAPLTGVYQGEFKFIDLPLPELYDLERDPAELVNLIGERAGLARRLSSALESVVAANSTEDSRRIRTADVDAETVARLSALGYTVSPRAAADEREYTADDDPKRLVHLSDKLDAGVAAHLAGRPGEAIRLFREIIEERPSFANAYANLAYVLRETGRAPEAIEVLENALEDGIHTRTMLARLGAYLQEVGRVEESVDILEAVVAEDPTYAEAYNYLAVAYAKQGRTREAIEAIDELLELDPSYASAYANLGSIQLGERRFDRAEASFRRALEIDPRLASAWNGLGVVMASTGREPDAITAWQRSVELDPRQFDTLFNLGTLMTKLNRFEEAIPYLEQFVHTAPPDQYGDDIPRVKRLISQLKSRV